MKLKVLKGAKPGREFQILEGDNLLGRSLNTKGCNFIDLADEDLDQKISHEHALIEKHGTVVKIRDLGSLNGTFVNSQDRLNEGNEIDLKNGDRIILGKTAFVVTE